MLKNILPRIGAAALSACLLLALAACGKDDASLSAPPPTTSAPGATTTGAPAHWEAFRFGSEAPGPEGCYIHAPRLDGGINILYADYASGQLVYLCNRPECTHDDESCTSFRSEESAGSLRFYGGRLYMLDPYSMMPEHIPYLSVCDANGENAKNLMALESGSMMTDLFAADGEAFYTLQTTYEDDTDPFGRARLVRIALANGATTHVNDADYSNAEILCGVEDEVVLYTYTVPEGGGNIMDQTILGVNKTTGEERVIYRVPSSYIAGAEGGYAYVVRMEDGALDAINLQTGEVQAIPFDNSTITLYAFDPNVADPPLMYSPRGIFDGKLFLDCSEDFDGMNYQRAQYAIDLSTGQVTRCALTMDFEARRGAPISICAETKDDFLVLRNYVNNPYPSINKDGTPYEAPNITNQYALISKADFYASNPNYRDFVLS